MNQLPFTTERPLQPLGISDPNSQDNGKVFSVIMEVAPVESKEVPPSLGSLNSEPLTNPGVTSGSTSAPLPLSNSISGNISTMPPVGEEEKGEKYCSKSLDSTLVSNCHKQPSESPVQNSVCHDGSTNTLTPCQQSNGPTTNLKATSPCKQNFSKCIDQLGDAIKISVLESLPPVWTLIGDFSQTFLLPDTNVKHKTLRRISPDTLARLINGEFAKDITSYQIIDCRFPYEYNGGHIRGAKNIYTKDHLVKEFIDNLPPLDLKTSNRSRNIIVFHCEFSQYRGPRLYNFLRLKDRQRNCFPELHYPEMYVLKGGYKEFFESHKELCEPCGYHRMAAADKHVLQQFYKIIQKPGGDKSQASLTCGVYLSLCPRLYS